MERKILVAKGHVELDNPDLILSSEEKSILLNMSSTLKDQQEQLSNICNILSNLNSESVLKKNDDKPTVAEPSLSDGVEASEGEGSTNPL